MTEVRRLLISGQVQGVGFRYSMQREARHLGALGWVRNLHSGEVEAVVSGPPDVLAAMIAWARPRPMSIMSMSNWRKAVSTASSSDRRRRFLGEPFRRRRLCVFLPVIFVRPDTMITINKIATMPNSRE